MAYMILNCLEVVFWAAVLFLKIQGMTQFCQGVACSLSGAIIFFVITIM